MARGLKVMHVSFSLDTGGAEVVILDIVRRLNRSRFQPMVCSFASGGELLTEFQRYDIPVVNVRKRAGSDLRFFVRLWSMFREHEIDIVHCHNSPMWVVSTLPARLAGVRGVMLTEHANHRNMSWKFRTAAAWLQRATAMITVNSMQVQRALVEDFGIGAHRIVLVRNGIDVSAMRPSKDAALKRVELGIPRDARVVGNVARMVPVKDHSTLLRAFAQVVARMPNARLALVGSGELEGSLRHEAETLGITASVHFLGARTDVPEILSTMDVFVLASRKEGQSIAVLEAMAAGVPVVATNTGGTPELVIDGETGLLVRSAQPEAMANGILQLLENAGQAAGYAAAARRRLLEFHDMPAIVAQYEQIYEAIGHDAGSRSMVHTK
ncbi:MAG: GT4 family glycosyltransferase PelF [Longimicrobiales bacterium]